MRLGVTEILLILVLALVVFGGGKLAGVGKALGQSIRVLCVCVFSFCTYSYTACMRWGWNKEKLKNVC